MDERYTTALLATVGTMLAAAVILAEVTGAYRQAAFSGGLGGAFCLGT